MSFLDATAPELAAACGVAEIEPEDALVSFIAHFSAKLVGDRLGDASSARIDEVEPSYFRYLVLTSAIAVNDIAGVDATTNDFRIRLGQALGVGKLHSVRGVNLLWEKLANWSARQRSKGMPIREVVLPDPGNWNLIGYAVRMAFPAWRDRSQFTAILKDIDVSIRRSPSRLVSELTRAHRSFRIPTAIENALDDFATRLRAGQTMLSGDRFWSLVTSIEAGFLAEQGSYQSSSPIIEMTFSGYEQDEPEFRLFKSRNRQDEEIVLPEANWADIIGPSAFRSVGRAILSLRNGYAVFKKSAGCWICDEGGVDGYDRCLVIAKKGSPARLWKLGASWRGIDGEWSISSQLGGAELQRFLGKEPFGHRELNRPQFGGGIRLKHNVYLGRPGFLPTVEQTSSGSISVERLTGDGELSADRSGELSAKHPLNGIWRVAIDEAGSRMDLSVAFERNSPEPLAYGTIPASEKWLLEKELTNDEPLKRPALTLGSRAPSLKTDTTQLDGLCEAIFSKAQFGWREGELISLLLTVVPSAHLVWDVLRSFQEAGWLDAYASRTWKSRTWVCRPPRLVMLSDNYAIADGALGAVLVEKVRQLADNLSVDIRLDAGVSEFSPMTMHLGGSRIYDLAVALDWPIAPLEGLPTADPAHHWSEDQRTPDGRFLAGTWSHDIGLFLERPTDSESVAVERWVRERGDEADLYVIRQNGEILQKTVSRVRAILEGHRLNRIPIFSGRGENIIRLKKSGYLPLPIARQLRFRCGTSSGPFGPVGGTWIYTYITDREAGGWLRKFLQDGLEFDGRGEIDMTATLIEWRHRGGRRPGWNANIG